MSRPCRDDGQARDGRRLTVIFPADHAGDPVALLHPSALVNPVVGERANPIRTTSTRRDITARAQQLVLVRAAVRKIRHGGKPFDQLLIAWTEIIDATVDAIRNARRAGARINPSTDGIPGKKSNVQPARNCPAKVLIHFQ